MVTGPFINTSAVLVGGVLGALTQPTVAGTDPHRNDLYFWPGVIGHRHFTGH